MSLVIAIDVPQQVEIKSTGVPMHETEVEFSVKGEGVCYNFPAKMVNDDMFIFTLTDCLEKHLDQTLDYNLFVHYGNARFQADNGSFNLISKKSFDAKLKDQNTGETVKTSKKTESISANSLAKKLLEREQKKETKKVITESSEEETKIVATKPIPTPEPTPTVTLKDAKEALKKSASVAEGDNEYNQKIKEILKSISKTATPTLSKDNKTNEAKDSAKFFEEVQKLKEINEDRKKRQAEKQKEKKIKDIIQSSKKDK